MSVRRVGRLAPHNLSSNHSWTIRYVTLVHLKGWFSISRQSDSYPTYTRLHPLRYQFRFTSRISSKYRGNHVRSICRSRTFSLSSLIHSQAQLNATSRSVSHSISLGLSRPPSPLYLDEIRAPWDRFSIEFTPRTYTRSFYNLTGR